MRHKALVLAVMCALLLPAVAQNKPNKKSTQADAAQPAVPAGDQQLSKADQMFLKALIQEDMSEIGLAQMALQKSSDRRVMDYAQTKILDADPQMRDGAKQLATQGGMTLPSKPNGRQIEMRDKLSKKSGKYFESAYMSYEASQQVADVKLVDAELKATSNPAVKSYVTKEKAPVVDAASTAKKISQEISTEMTHFRRKSTATGSNQPSQ